MTAMATPPAPATRYRFRFTDLTALEPLNQDIGIIFGVAGSSLPSIKVVFTSRTLTLHSAQILVQPEIKTTAGAAEPLRVFWTKTVALPHTAGPRTRDALLAAYEEHARATLAVLEDHFGQPAYDRNRVLAVFAHTLGILRDCKMGLALPESLKSLQAPAARHSPAVDAVADAVRLVLGDKLVYRRAKEALHPCNYANIDVPGTPAPGTASAHDKATALRTAEATFRELAPDKADRLMALLAAGSASAGALAA